MSVQLAQDMIVYYSTHKNEFKTTPKFNNETHNIGKKCALDSYKTIDRYTVNYDEKYVINHRKKVCNCRYFLKNAVCSHILGYMYKKFGQESWFGEKYSIKATDFNYHMNRGGTIKLGRYKLSKPALSQY